MWIFQWVQNRTHLNLDLGCQKKFVCTSLLLATFPLKARSHLNLLLVIAGHLECAHGEEKKVPEQLKEGGEFALLILHPSPGNKRLKQN